MFFKNAFSERFRGTKFLAQIKMLSSEKRFECKVRFKLFNHCLWKGFAFDFGQKYFMRKSIEGLLKIH